MDSPMSTVDSPSAAQAATDGACLRVLYILDITGSMSSEIEAVKQAVAEMVALCTELQSPNIAFAFITFTEGDKSGCHVSLKETTSPEEAQRYINTIQLSRPPDNPSIDACGDDGPENQKAALARTTDLNPAIPTIAFLITDAEPHLASDNSRTAQHELNYLTAQRGLHPDIAGDVFKTFRSTALDHFNGNLILNCVVYGGNRYHRASQQQPTPTQALYGSFAQQTGGMLMQPTSRQSSVLAEGLMDVVKVLLRRVQGAAGAGGAAAEGADELRGFDLIDVSGLNPERASERDAAGEAVFGDSAAIFQIAVERMVAVCGSKWSRRAIGMTAPAEQLQFVWRAARFISLCSKPAAADPEAAAKHAAAAAGELEKLLQLRSSIMQQLPKDKKGHFSITEADIRHLAAEAAAAAAAPGGAGGASVSAISLESVGDALEDDADWEDWLAAVMKLLLGFPMHLQLPLDKFGQPDFMDAWSAVVEELGVDRLASSEFMKLLGDAPKATGPTDRLQHNAFLVVVEPSDKLASIVFRVASGTQALDYVTGVLMGAKGFLPNLHAGTAAACLLRVISQRSALSEFQWAQVQQIAHTLACRHRNAAKGVTEQLLAGQGNPEDNISKLMLGALRVIRCGDGSAAATAAAAEKEARQRQVLRLVLQELLASIVQRYYGKSTPESDAAYEQSVLQYLPLEALFGPACTAATMAAMDPLQQLHPLEQLDLTSLAKQQPDQGRQVVQPDWQVQVVQRLCSGCACAAVPAHPVVLQFMQRAGRMLAAVLPAEGPAAAAAVQAVRSDTRDASCSSSSRELQAASEAVAYCWPDWQEGLLQALLLRMRTARYRSHSSTSEPMEVDGAAAAAPAAVPALATAATAAGGGSGGDVTWEPIDAPSCLELAVKRLKQGLAEQLQGYRRARNAEAKQQLVAAAAKALQKHADDKEAASAALEALQLQLGPTAAAVPAGPAAKGPCASLLGLNVLLQRSDVPLVLEQLTATAVAAADAAEPAGVSLSQLHALVLGGWASQGPQALRRSQMVLMLCQGAGPAGDELLAAIMSLEVCCRAAGHNRHGHSASMPYPGPEGWTLGYQKDRAAAIAGKRTKLGKQRKTDYYLDQMRRFSAMAAWAREAAAADAAQLAVLQCVLGQYNDANKLRHAMTRIEGVLGRPVPASMVE